MRTLRITPLFPAISISLPKRAFPTDCARFRSLRFRTGDKKSNRSSRSTLAMKMPTAGERCTSELSSFADRQLHICWEGRCRTCSQCELVHLTVDEGSRFQSVSQSRCASRLLKSARWEANRTPYVDITLSARPIVPRSLALKDLGRWFGRRDPFARKPTDPFVGPPAVMTRTCRPTC